MNRWRIMTGTTLAALALLGHAASAQNSVTSRRLQAFQVLAEPTGERRRGQPPDKCGLHVIAATLRHRGELSPGQRTALSLLQSRPAMQTSIANGVFCVHFDTTGPYTPALLDSSSHQRIEGTARAYADSVLSTATYVFAYETSVLGFAPPPSDSGLGGGPQYDIYIEALGGGFYGQTTPDNDIPDGGTSSTFIEIDNDFSFVSPDRNKGLPAMRVTIAHEFHHAIQIGSYGFWLSDVWFHEITSVWMEDVVFHGVNDYLNYLFSTDSQFQQPGIPLTSNDFIMYSRGIWGKYLTKRIASDAMLRIWQSIRSRAPLAAIDYTLNGYGSSLSAAFAEWAIWNYFTGVRADTLKYYSEGRLFPLVAETSYEMNVPTQQLNGSLSCLSGTYLGFFSGADSVTVALANVNTSCPSSGVSPVPFTLTVSTTTLNSGRSIGGNLFVRLDVAEPSQWVEWDIENNTVKLPVVSEGTAFPNPFHPRGQNVVSLKATAAEATVMIYSSAMNLVYSGVQAQSWTPLREPVFVWDGRTAAGTMAASGIYIFVLDLGNRKITGKIALVRK